MIHTRETIVNALLSRVQSVAIPGPTPTPFQTVSRKWKGVDAALTLDLLPALFLIELPEAHRVQGRGMPAKVDLSFDLVCVVRNLENVDGCSAINPWLDVLEASLQPTPQDKLRGGNLSLGGLVYDVWIEGTVQKNPSFLGGGASLAVAPLHIRSL